MSGHKSNLFIYFIIIVIASIGIIYGNEIKDSFGGLRIWQMGNILLLLLGIPFLFLQKSASLPDFIDSDVSNSIRLLQPVLIGAIFGILDVIVIKLIQHPEPYTDLPPFLQPFPYSLFLFFSGAFEIEVFYRLIPLTLILILGKRLAQGRRFNHFLWAGLIVTSIREPLEQLPTGETWYVSYALLTGFSMNLLQAIYYKKAGFIATLTLRLGHYLFWHVLLGIYVQFFELAG